MGKKINVLSHQFWPQLLKYMGSHSYCTCWVFGLRLTCLICLQTRTPTHHQKSHVTYEWRRWSTARRFLLQPFIFTASIVRFYFHVTAFWLSSGPRLAVIPMWLERSTCPAGCLCVWVVSGWPDSRSSQSSAHLMKSIDTIGATSDNSWRPGSLPAFFGLLLYSFRSNLLG